MTIKTFAEYMDKFCELWDKDVELYKLCYRELELSKERLRISSCESKDIDRHIRKMERNVGLLETGRADIYDGIRMLEKNSDFDRYAMNEEQKVLAINREIREIEEREIVLTGEVIEILDELIEYSGLKLENDHKELKRREAKLVKDRKKLAEEKVLLKEKKKEKDVKEIAYAKKMIRLSKRVISDNKDCIKSTKRCIESAPKTIEGYVERRDRAVESRKKMIADLENTHSEYFNEETIAKTEARLKERDSIIEELKKNHPGKGRPPSGNGYRTGGLENGPPQTDACSADRSGHLPVLCDRRIGKHL